MNEAEALGVADKIVAAAKPDEQVEAVVTWEKGTEIRAYEGSVEHLIAAEDIGVGVRVVKEGKQGLSWSGVIDDAELKRCLDDARDNCRFGTTDPHAGLAEPDGVEEKPLNLVNEELPTVSTADKVNLALELDALVRGLDKRIVGHEGADYSDGWGVAAICSTAGIRTASSESGTYAGVYALGSDGDDTSTGFGMSVGRGFEELDIAAAADEAVQRCVTLLGATKPQSSKTTVVLDPYVCSQILSLVAEMLSAEEVLRGRSPFADRLGEQIASPLLTLTDDPGRAEAPTAAGADGEGLACRQVPLIEAGILEGFLHNSYTARSTGGSSTGSASRASHHSIPGVAPKVMIPQPGSQTAEEIYTHVGDGLLVMELAGLHSGVNPVSGDLSVGAEGVVIRGGELAEPVREITIASTLQRMLSNVLAVGSDTRYFPWESAGVTMAIGEMTMSGS